MVQFVFESADASSDVSRAVLKMKDIHTHIFEEIACTYVFFWLIVVSELKNRSSREKRSVRDHRHMESIQRRFNALWSYFKEDHKRDKMRQEMK